MATAAIPAMNPTGSNMMPGASSGTPMLPSPIPTGGPGNYNFGNSTNPNPPGTGIGTVPGAGASPTMMGTTNTSGVPGGVPGFNTAEQQNLQNSLAGTFHTGYGTYLETLLNSQGGYNAPLTAQNVQATTAAMQQNIDKGYGQLQTQLGQQGVSPESSVAALESSNYMSNAVTQENAIAAQDYFNMWSQSMGLEFGLAQSLAGPQAAEKASESTMSKLAGIGSFIGNVLGSGASYSSDSGSSFTL